MLQSERRAIAPVVTRMTTSGADLSLTLMRLRILTETARAVATGVTNVAFGRGGHSLRRAAPGRSRARFHAAGVRRP